MEYTIYASLVIITLMCLWAIISIPKNYLFKSLLIPVMIGIAISTWYTYNSILGYGTEFKADDKVIYHSHVSAKKQERIYILLTSFGDDEPRLHIYPWSEELEKQLDKAKEKGSQGIMIVGELRKQKKQYGAVLNLDAEEYIFYDMPPNEWMPKDSLDN